jgi:hypothetical protein
MRLGNFNLMDRGKAPGLGDPKSKFDAREAQYSGEPIRICLICQSSASSHPQHSTNAAPLS